MCSLIPRPFIRHVYHFQYFPPHVVLEAVRAGLVGSGTETSDCQHKPTTHSLASFPGPIRKIGMGPGNEATHSLHFVYLYDWIISKPIIHLTQFSYCYRLLSTCDNIFSCTWHQQIEQEHISVCGNGSMQHLFRYGHLHLCIATTVVLCE